MEPVEIKRQIESTFDEVSERYDQNRFFTISARKMADLVPSVDGIKLLDVSTGTGAIAIEVARKNRLAIIEAIDMSKGMLKKARRKANGEGFSNIRFKQFDVEELPYPDKTFDVITCGYALFFYPDMEATYQRLIEIVKPGGTFLFSSFPKEAFNPYAALFLKGLKQDYQIEPPSVVRERLQTSQQIKALERLGRPSKIDVEHLQIRYPITVNEWWSLLNNAGYKGLLDQLNKAQLERFKQKHIQAIDAFATDGFIELNADTLFGVVHV